MEFNKLLERYRTTQGLTKNRLAKELGVRPQTMTKYVIGAIVPTIDGINKLIEIFNLKGAERLEFLKAAYHNGITPKSRELLEIIKDIHRSDIAVLKKEHTKEKDTQSNIDDFLTSFKYKMDSEKLDEITEIVRYFRRMKIDKIRKVKEVVYLIGSLF